MTRTYRVEDHFGNMLAAIDQTRAKDIVKTLQHYAVAYADFFVTLRNRHKVYVIRNSNDQVVYVATYELMAEVIRQWGEPDNTIRQIVTKVMLGIPVTSFNSLQKLMSRLQNEDELAIRDFGEVGF